MDQENGGHDWTALLQGIDLQQPVGMLNQINFHAEAQYEPTSGETPCSGVEAFSRCSSVLMPALAKMGAEVILTGMIELTGAPEKWDMTFVVRYRRALDLFELMQTETYAKAAVHRAAGVSDSRLVMMRFEKPGALLGTMG
jgi:hypothetical protein